MAFGGRFHRGGYLHTWFPAFSRSVEVGVSVTLFFAKKDCSDRNIGANIVMVIFIVIAGMCFYEGKTESVIFDSRQRTLTLSRTSFCCNKKMTWHVSDWSRFFQVSKIVILSLSWKKAHKTVDKWIFFLNQIPYHENVETGPHRASLRRPQRYIKGEKWYDILRPYHKNDKRRAY